MFTPSSHGGHIAPLYLVLQGGMEVPHEFIEV